MSLGKNIFQGMIWSAVERISIQTISFILGIILARLLTPEEYGTLGLLIVFISLSQVFIDSGFSKALIQKKDRTEDDKSTVLIFSLAISIFIYFILWLSAPIIASFYGIESLILLLRVLAVSLIISALSAVPATMITIEMNFRLYTKINLISTITSGVAAIALAYYGFGVWALVFQTLIRATLTSILLWSIVRWKPNFVFSKTSFKELFSFGSKLLASNLMGTFSSQLNALLIGKYLGPKDLGFYTRGIQFSDFIFGIFNSSINNVLLPGLSPVQDQKELLVAHTRTIIKSSAILVVPVFISLSILAEPIILVLLSEKWVFAAPIMQVFCIARLISIISGINVNLLYVIGETGLVLKQQYFKITVRVVLLVAALKFGIFYIALAELFATAIHFFINTYYPGKIMKYGAIPQLKDISLILVSGLVMAIVIFLTTLLVDNLILKLFLASLLAIPTYFGMLILFKIKELNYIFEKLKAFFKKE